MTPDIAEQIIATLHTRIDELIVERDSWKQAHDEQVSKLVQIANERDAALEQNTALDAKLAKLEAAAKLALYALCRVDDAPIPLDHGERLSLAKAITALRQAGVRCQIKK